MIDEIEITKTEELEEISMVPAESALSAGTTNPLTTSRQRARNLRGTTMRPDLLKAHVALMEKEVILPKQSKGRIQPETALARGNASRQLTDKSNHPMQPERSDLFRLVQYHYHTLQTWHDQHTGWRIQRSSTVIRLVRQLSAATPGYLYERLREPRDFACLTWILWYAENRQLSGRGNEQQFLLSQLAESITDQSAQGLENEAKFDFRKPADRYSIQRALQYLEDLGGLQLVDGQTREWVEQTPDADVLYEFTDVIRSLVFALNPQRVNVVANRLNDNASAIRPSLLVDAWDGLAPASDATTSRAVLSDGNGRALLANSPSTGARSIGALTAGDKPLVRAWRALLLGPALFKFDDPAAFAALVEYADEVANELLETFGWLLDIRRDYACIIRASGMSSGPVTPMTLFGATDHIAMLLCTVIRSQVESGTWPSPDAYGCLHVTTEDMAELFYTLRERYGENWGTDARSKSSRSLLNDVYKKMRQLGLLRGPDESGNVLILPTVARYSATYDKPGEGKEPARNTPTKSSTRPMSKNIKETSTSKKNSLWSPDLG